MHGEQVCDLGGSVETHLDPPRLFVLDGLYAFVAGSAEVDDEGEG